MAKPPHAHKATARKHVESRDNLGPVLDDLARCVQNESRLKVDRIRLVALARQRGASWHMIALVLGVTPQAAHKHYGKLVTSVGSPRQTSSRSSGARHP